MEITLELRNNAHHFWSIFKLSLETWNLDLLFIELQKRHYPLKNTWKFPSQKDLEQFLFQNIPY